MLGSFNEYTFKQKVDKALDKVRTILDNNRHPEYAADVHHEYEDKYLLAEFLTNSTIASHFSSLEVLGVNGKVLAQLKEWAQKRSVTLRLSSEEKCARLREETREVQSDTKHVTKGLLGKTESYSVTKVTEYFWSFTASWELSAFVGVESEKRLVLQSHTGTIEIKTSVDTTPRPVSVVRPNIDVNITWLLQNIDDNRTPTFKIDRQHKDCRTPRRNPQVAAALTFLYNFHTWAGSVTSYFKNTLFPTQQEHGIDLSALNDNEVFNPVLPVFEKPQESSSSSRSVLPPVFMSAFLGEQTRSLDNKLKDLARIFPADTKVITVVEAKQVVILIHTQHVSEAYSEGVDSIENMLTNQLIAAIGKQVTPQDFSNYLTFHNRKIFKEEFRPQPFCFAIRRPDHYPEGVLSLESGNDPVSTIVSHNIATRPMKFPINAATNISFFGDRFLHGFVSHQFADQAATPLSLCARARQFSSFILLVGRIVSADVFDPKHAIVIQNKDDLKIPLMLETIPTPKEFKDAIASLSPEQQRFCKAFRSMQLESTLFGVCIIQIKPQLEKLLKLPEDSLTKEIQLSQDLLSLFITYQIPSDLVSYDGPEDDAQFAKINRVKEYVSRMQAMLDKEKKVQLEEAQNEQRMRQAQPRYDTMMLESASSGPVFTRTATTLSVSSAPRSRSAAPGAVYPSAPPPMPMASMAPMAPPPAPVSAPIVSVAPPPRPTTVATPAPTPQAQPQQPQAPKDKQWSESKDVADISSESSVVDYTKIPVELERSFEQFDENNALRPTIINPGTTWSKSFQKTLLSQPEKKQVYSEEQDKEKDKAFDLLDALTKSGALSVDQASLHVVIASTHCFTKNIIQTVIQDNINPIEKVENSSLIVASTIHRTPPAALIAGEHLPRISTTSALLLGNTNVNAIEGAQK